MPGRIGRPRSGNTGKNRSLNIHPSRHGKVKQVIEDSVDLIPENINKTRSDQVKDRFFDYMEQSDLRWYTSRVPKKSNDEKYRMKLIQRIDRAIQQNIVEIDTYQFFNFVDTLAHGRFAGAYAEISVVFCGETIEKRIIFDSSISNIPDDSEANISYVEISKGLSLSINVVYLVAKVRTSTIDDGKRITNGRASFATPAYAWYYGARMVMNRKDGILTANHTNSSIPMFTKKSAELYHMNFLSGDKWETNPDKLKELSSFGQTMAKKGPIPMLYFEMTDEHCDEDWKLLGELALLRSTVRNPIHLITTPFIVSIEEDQENTAPGQNQPSEMVLVNAREYHCPICMTEFPSVENLIQHMKGKYRNLSFSLQTDGRIEVALRPNSLQSITRSTWEPHIPQDFRPGQEIPSSYLSCQIVHYEPRETFGGSQFHKANCNNAVLEWAKRDIMDLVDATEFESRVMQLFNEFSLNRQHMMSKTQTDDLLEEFVRVYESEVTDGPMATHVCHLISLLAARQRVSPHIARKLCVHIMSRSTK